ncbi:PIN domain-containing protein [Nostoc sp. FACHB-87]|uniref:PIN domain-containing protein n=1 Tax=Nostocaceae TaxID=1162 RepID=UPI0016895C06|nr:MULTISPECIES: PIN domain-containing protein [Nostocaceae]MBD2455035.1 PIN domain-containing protein [Nostoc sp. FACHB-87]MBD2474644.1 PIN domain-containing protein [Anabaena sp. FACHB-83]
MKRVLFDSDVLLDILAQRQPFVIASAQALNTVMKQQVQGFVSGHAVTNIFYILRRQIGSEAAHKLIENLLQHIQVASVTDKVIHQALQSSIKDFEDAVTSAAAMNANLEVIVTRNKADFTASSVPAILPEELLKMLAE